MLDRQVFTIVALFSAVFIPSSYGLQCYSCGCIPGISGPVCNQQVLENCTIQYVENMYCYILVTPGEIELGHNPNSVLNYYKSTHYIRTTERFSYNPTISDWNPSIVPKITYGCNWNLCNSPRIISLLPESFSYEVSKTTLNSLLIPQPGQSVSTCYSCGRCTNQTAQANNCPAVNCTGSCIIDDHIDDPGFNDGCSISFSASCVSSPIETVVDISGNYYIDDRDKEITEIDITCSKTNCNSYQTAEGIRSATQYTINVTDALYFRPNPGQTTPPPATGQIACYSCYCRRQKGAAICSDFNCTIEYRTDSFCEIARDFTEYGDDQEVIVLGHVSKLRLEYRHYILATETVVLYKNTTYAYSEVDKIAYVCDWDLCNDPRIVDKLSSSFQFFVDAQEISKYIQGPGTPSCLDCTVCSNSSAAADVCPSKPCPNGGHCAIVAYIDDEQFDDCEYAFQASCQPGETESKMIITALYDIDGDNLETEEFDLYCSSNRCNSPSTISTLRNYLDKNILLDPIFINRPATVPTLATSSPTTTTRTAPPPTTTTAPAQSSSTDRSSTGPTTTGSYATKLTSFHTFSLFLIHSLMISLFFHF